MKCTNSISLDSPRLDDAAGPFGRESIASKYNQLYTLPEPNTRMLKPHFGTGRRHTVAVRHSCKTRVGPVACSLESQELPLRWKCPHRSRSNYHLLSTCKLSPLVLRTEAAALIVLKHVAQSSLMKGLAFLDERILRSSPPRVSSHLLLGL